MAEVKYRNKVIFNGEVLMDSTGTTVTPQTLDKGITALDKTGALIEGTSTKDADTSDATLLASEALIDKIFYANGERRVGTMPDNSSFSGSISSKDEKVTIPMGFTDGSVSIGISEAEKAKLIGANIKQGVTILDVPGEYSGEGATLQEKTVIPSSVDQTILPDSGYDYLSSVVVKAIPYTETENTAGGITVTIGA